MPVFGYLAIPRHNALEELRTTLSAMEHCEVIPAENRDVLVLVTDTPDEKEEKRLQNRLKSLKSLQSLSMTFGHSDQAQPDTNKR